MGIFMNTLEDDVKDILLENIEGMTRQEAVYYIEYDAIPDMGCVSGLILTEDTEAFASRHHLEIVERLLSEGMSVPSSLNDIAWSAWNLVMPEISEEVVEEIITELEVPYFIVDAFNEVSDGIYIDLTDNASEYGVDYVIIDADVLSDTEDLIGELKAFAKYNHPDTKNYSDIEDIVSAMEDEYFDGSSSIKLRYKKEEK